MCRSIKTLRGADAVSDEEIQAAALQFVRKVSGYRSPSVANRDAFTQAVDGIGDLTRELLDTLAPPGTRPSSAGDAGRSTHRARDAAL